MEWRYDSQIQVNDVTSRIQNMKLVIDSLLFLSLTNASNRTCVLLLLKIVYKTKTYHFTEL